MPSCRLQEEGARGRTPNLFVRHQEEGHPRARLLETEAIKDLNRDRNSGLHIEDTRAFGNPPVRREGQFSNRSHRPHGIDVPQEQRAGSDRSQLRNHAVTA